MDRHCPACEARQVFGVVMEPLPDGGHRCPRCRRREYPARYALGDDPADIYAAREEAEEIRECYAEDASRRGRCVPETATGGGDSVGASKARVNPYKWMRRGE